MATTPKKAPAKKAPAKKAPARKTTAKRAAPAKSAASSSVSSLKQSAEKALNVYLGVIGKGYDLAKDNLESVRKENEKRVKDFEKRGVALRKELTKRWDKLDITEEFEGAVEDAKEQIGKLQDKFEDAVESAKDAVESAKDKYKAA
jgi:hypothetical protein